VVLEFICRVICIVLEFEHFETPRLQALSCHLLILHYRTEVEHLVQIKWIWMYLDHIHRAVFDTVTAGAQVKLRSPASKNSTTHWLWPLTTRSMKSSLPKHHRPHQLVGPSNRQLIDIDMILI
jgi:hypothetical protein